MDPELTKRLDELGKQLGVAVERLWDVGTRYVYAEGLVNGILCVAVALVGVGLAVKCARLIGAEMDDSNYIGIPNPVTGMGFLLGLGGAIGAAFAAAHYFVQVVSPEGALIARLLGKS